MIFYMTHQGFKRESNEDRFLVKQYDNGSFLVSVADGMGGEAGGEVAAQIAIESLTSFDPGSQSVDKDLLGCFYFAGQRILEEVARNKDLKGMGTTATAVFKKGGVAHWAHVGDSRLYLFRNAVLKQVTEDHTMAGLLLSEGKITAEEARTHRLKNALFECIGCANFEVDNGSFEVEQGDLLLLSTDGLHGEVPEEILTSILKAKTALKDKIESLTQAALERGGKDNITVIVAQV